MANHSIFTSDSRPLTKASQLSLVDSGRAFICSTMTFALQGGAGLVLWGNVTRRLAT